MGFAINRQSRDSFTATKRPEALDLLAKISRSREFFFVARHSFKLLGYTFLHLVTWWAGIRTFDLTIQSLCELQVIRTVGGS